MAQDNPFDQFDSAAQPVPAEAIKPIISSPPEQQTVWQTLTPEQAAAEGLPAGGTYQRSSDGRIQTVQAPPKEEKGPADLTRDVADVRAELQNVIEKAEQAKTLSRDAWFATGFGAETARDMGGTAAADVAALLDTIGSSVAFDRLSRMRAESPTGGALGNVTERELDLLKSTIASLKQSQSDTQFQAAMDDVVEAYQRVLNKLPAPEGEGENNQGQDEQEAAGGTGPQLTVTEEESTEAWGQPAYDAEGNLVGFGYEGEIFDAQGESIGLAGNVSFEGEPLGFLEGLRESFTGELRSTEEIEALPDWTDMPLTEGFMDDPLKMAKVAAATMMTGPEETAQIIQSNFPNVTVRQDRKGNYILTSPIDGQEYAIKPGFRSSDIPRAAGATLAFTPAGRATSTGGAMAAAGATQAGIEAGQAASGGQFNADEVAFAAGGAGAGELLAKGAKTIGGARKFLPSRGGSAVASDASEVVEAGARENVPVMTTDVRPPRTWFGRWLQQTGEKLPLVGTAETRAKQQAAREAMIEGLYDEYTATPAVIDDVTRDFIETRKGEIARLSQQKREVFESLSGAPAPEVDNALATLDRAISRYGDKQSFGALSAKLNGWRDDLANATSIADVEDVRKSIGDTFNDESMRSASTAMRDVVNGPEGLYNALRTDMGDYIRENAGGGALAKWKSANRELADFADDLEKTTLSRVMRSGEATPEEASKLLFSAKPSDVRALMSNLSPQGRERARSLIVQRLVDQAGGIDDLSTARFRTALKKSRDKFGVAFPAPEADRLTGMLRLLQVTRRAENAAVNTPTGQSLLPLAGAGGLGFLGGGWMGAAGAGAASSTAFRIYESKPVRNLLIRLSKTEPGSKAETNTLEMLSRAVGAASAPRGGTMETQELEQPITEVR